MADLPDDETPSREQLWTRTADGKEFELCCIPFFVYDLALGDVLELDPAGTVKSVLRRSGRSVFRVWLGESSVDRTSLMREFDALGALQEWRTENYCALDAADATIAHRLEQRLLDRHGQGELQFERATRQVPRGQ